MNVVGDGFNDSTDILTLLIRQEVFLMQVLLSVDKYFSWSACKLYIVSVFCDSHFGGGGGGGGGL